MAARNIVRAWPGASSGRGRFAKFRLYCGLWRNVLAHVEVVVATPTTRGTQPVPAVHDSGHCWILGRAAHDQHCPILGRTARDQGAALPVDKSARQDRITHADQAHVSDALGTLG